MALFTSMADQNLPLLTQFYQLEFDPENPVGSELDHWVWRVYKRSLETLGEELEEEWKDFTLSTQPARFLEDADLSIEEINLRDLSSYHYSVCKFMEIAAGLPSSEGDFTYIEKVNEFVSRFTYRNKFVLMEDGESSRMDLISIVDTFQDWMTNQYIWTKTKMVDELTEGVKFEGFKVCPECSNVYFRPSRTAKSQIYCSRRCASRAGERRRYTERFKEYRDIKKLVK